MRGKRELKVERSFDEKRWKMKYVERGELEEQKQKKKRRRKRKCEETE